MTTPFTYLIGWSSLDKWYYGVKYSKNCSPQQLWTTYFTSSSYVQYYRKTYGEPDVIIIRKIFNNEQKARIWEAKVLKKLKAQQSFKWINQSNADAPPIQYGPCTNKRRRNISKARLNTIKLVCKYCNKQCDPGNFKQYHDNNCKFNPNVNFDIINQKKEISKQSYQKQLQNGTYHKPTTPKGLFTCPHCQKQGTNYGNMHRWHFDRCPKAP